MVISIGQEQSHTCIRTLTTNTSDTGVSLSSYAYIRTLNRVSDIPELGGITVSHVESHAYVRALAFVCFGGGLLSTKVSGRTPVSVR